MAPDRKPTRILVADDEPNLRLLYRSELEADGYQVELAENGQEALKAVEKGGIDLVVLDIRMPGMDGVEVLQKILARDRTMPVILNTAYDSYRDNYLTWSADAYVVKSSDVTALKQKIQQVLAERRGDRADAGG